MEHLVLSLRNSKAIMEEKATSLEDLVEIALHWPIFEKNCKWKLGKFYKVGRNQ